jgi:exodeoxyribonuclease-5
MDTVFVAMTGKAASVLEAKGLKASTIHSAIYAPKGEGKTLKHLRELRAQQLAAPLPDVAEIRNLDAQIKALSGGGFKLRDRTRAFDGKLPKLIVVDEGSMVSERVARDLASFSVPTLVLGDPYQLPPVQAKPGYSSKPDVLLTTIHRQSGPLLDMATAARNGKPVPTYCRETRAGRYSGPYQVGLLSRFDQVIVHKNTTRWTIIDGLRAAQGREPGVPSPGDRIMVCRNDAEAGVVNGQQATVVDAKPVDEDAWLIETECGNTWVCDSRGFLDRDGQEAAKADRNSDLVAATFAQAITCYASQGSEWPDVAVIDESVSKEWLYTAVTRAQRECIVLTRKPTMTAELPVRWAA